MLKFKKLNTTDACVLRSWHPNSSLEMPRELNLSQVLNFCFHNTSNEEISSGTVFPGLPVISPTAKPYCKYFVLTDASLLVYTALVSGVICHSFRVRLISFLSVLPFPPFCPPFFSSFFLSSSILLHLIIRNNWGSVSSHDLMRFFCCKAVVRAEFRCAS